MLDRNTTCNLDRLPLNLLIQNDLITRSKMKLNNFCFAQNITLLRVSVNKKKGRKKKRKGVKYRIEEKGRK